MCAQKYQIDWSSRYGRYGPMPVHERRGSPNDLTASEEATRVATAIQSASTKETRRFTEGRSDARHEDEGQMKKRAPNLDGHGALSHLGTEYAAGDAAHSGRWSDRGTVAQSALTRYAGFHRFELEETPNLVEGSRLIAFRHRQPLPRALRKNEAEFSSRIRDSPDFHTLAWGHNERGNSRHPLIHANAEVWECLGAESGGTLR